ncbi:type VII secretion protein EccC [Mycolicibacterium rufum]|uniref:Type VII secretion protein EccC n=1 Tax=Mycolicibacterium rufum TaxID=318424 RepID=A0ABY3UE78_9MYCO|nr:type VII secretion protein EccC [Mycolicibacterium rufum]KGI67084.1 secretion protein EccC [Mycolicibacterium rufum]ULP37948.1 type VII secretion protein EccC [Mycolicibacterium rufum]
MGSEHPPGGRITLEAPPPLPEATPVSPLARLMPIVMIAAMVGMSALYLRSGGPAARSPMTLILPLMMLTSVVGMLVHGGRGATRTAEINAGRAEYLRYLDGVAAGLAASAAEQHVWLYRRHPDPAALWTTAGTDRRDERAPDHLAVRVGVGCAVAATTLSVPDLGPDDDPVTAGAVRRLVQERSVVRDVPVLVSLPAVRLVSAAGDPATARAVLRALVCQAAVAHPPDTLAVEAPAGAAWDWVKWLPHSRTVGTSRHRLSIADGAESVSPGEGVTVLAVRPAEPQTAVTVCADGTPIDAEHDVLSLSEALACARRIAGASARAGLPRRDRTDWCSLMAIDDPEDLHPEKLWARCTAEAALRVPIGVTDDGVRVELDIKEAAAGGMGPHGLCVGATGSGKSEFLRTLVLGMITAHSPDVLNLVLVDFKGGATFLGFEQARHVSAVITNLADEAPLVARMHDALSGEITRRQEVLRAAGNLANIADYQRMRARDGGLAPLPALFIVVDEFSELLSRHPDFADLFVAVGRLGRSLGVHLLLASQRLDEGRLRGLDAHLSYRICLKTFSAADSRAVLGVPDAYQLPAQPGAAYLKTASEQLTRFQTAFVSGRYAPREATGAVAAQRFTYTAAVRAPSPALAAKPLLDTVLTRLTGRGRAAHRVWLPPLSRSPALDDLLHSFPAGGLRVPIGVVDCPVEQRYEPLTVDLSGAAGNVAVVGAPQSGKSTALRTLVSALAASHDAGAVQIYCLDFGGGTLRTLAELPHVGCVAGRRDTDLCRRTVAHVEAVLSAREAASRRGHDHCGDVFLVVDGWATVRQDFDVLEPAITALAARGLSYGVHVVLAASRWADLRPALKDQIGTRIELRLGEAAESDMDRRRARELATAPPGRGLTRAGREMVIARPPAAAVCRHPDGITAPRVELLPEKIFHDTIARGPWRRGQVVVGLGERDLCAVTLDFTDHPHLLILGEGECGKSALLRALCTELVGTHSEDEVSLEIVDYRRTLLGVVDSGHLAGYSASPVALEGRLTALTARLTERMPDEHVTQRQLRDRSWWSGPEIFVIVDDYDLVAGATGNPLTPLADFLPHAKDLGLHVIVARRSGGAARALFDPVLARLRDMGCSGMTMSAAPEDGNLFGASRPGPLPAGRGSLTVRGRPDELIQVGWLDPP